jgi:hypothetical protein
MIARLRPRAANPIFVDAPQLVRAVRDVAGGYRSQHATILEGSVLPADDEFAVEHAADLEPVKLGVRR